jgi:hypothetical protein
MDRDHNTFVLLTKAYHGGMVTSGPTAVGIASAVLLGHYGANELAQQQPLRATDEGDSWLVEGSRVDPDLNGGGAWFDARVVALGHRIPDLELVNEIAALQSKKTDGSS